LADRHKTLPRDHYLLRLDNPGPKIRGPPLKNLGPKTCKICTDFTQLLTLIANISGTRQDIKNRKDVISNDSSHVQPNKPGELWSTIHKVVHVSLDPPKSTFSTDYISAPRWSVSVSVSQRCRSVQNSPVGSGRNVGP